ncbi:MAG: ABC transporter ATP-binding protein [Thermaerobacter sp.]|nr:ABC transporter ATP-binding protein [Thermaerobacter sp.]
MSHSSVLLQMENLSVTYFGPPDVVAVHGVTLDVKRGEILGLAGESGCGKTTLIGALTRLLPDNGEVTHGRIEFDGVDWLGLNEREVDQWRWTRVSLVSQSAMNSLNPVISIGEQITDAIFAHEPRTPKADGWDRARSLLRMVEVDPSHVHSYAHELSGGMRQRAMIAMALALKPDLVIMDEPTTALDVVVQAQIIHEIRSLQERLRFSVIFVTHDMSLLLSIADRIAIMYAGEVVEVGTRSILNHEASHPYTRGLIQSFPSVFHQRTRAGIPGAPPSMVNPPSGCRFHGRCEERMAVCSVYAPEDRDLDGIGHRVRCHLFGDSGITDRQPLAGRGEGSGKSC